MPKALVLNHHHKNKVLGGFLSQYYDVCEVSVFSLNFW